MKFTGRGVYVSPKAKLGRNVRIGDNTVIYDNVEIGDGSTICNDCVIGEPLNSFYRDASLREPWNKDWPQCAYPPAMRSSMPTAKSGTNLMPAIGLPFGKTPSSVTAVR